MTDSPATPAGGAICPPVYLKVSMSVNTCSWKCPTSVSGSVHMSVSVYSMIDVCMFSLGMRVSVLKIYIWSCMFFLPVKNCVVDWLVWFLWWTNHVSLFAPADYSLDLQDPQTPSKDPRPTQHTEPGPINTHTHKDPRPTPQHPSLVFVWSLTPTFF